MEQYKVVKAVTPDKSIVLKLFSWHSRCVKVVVWGSLILVKLLSRQCTDIKAVLFDKSSTVRLFREQYRVVRAVLFDKLSVLILLLLQFNANKLVNASIPVKSCIGLEEEEPKGKLVTLVASLLSIWPLTRPSESMPNDMSFCSKAVSGIAVV